MPPTVIAGHGKHWCTAVYCLLQQTYRQLLKRITYEAVAATATQQCLDFQRQCQGLTIKTSLTSDYKHNKLSFEIVGGQVKMCESVFSDYKSSFSCTLTATPSPDYGITRHDPAVLPSSPRRSTLTSALITSKGHISYTGRVIANFMFKRPFFFV